jgi:N-acetyl-anhydromuramoyl-L-alanine amidase
VAPPPTERSAGWTGGWWWHARRLPSPNHGRRPSGVAIDLAVLHSISLPPGEYGGPAIVDLFLNRLDCDAHPWFVQLRGLRVSAHFVLRRSGEVLQFVSCERRAWHAGVSCWRGRSGCNDWSIGIELEGLEGQAFEPRQYAALARLLRALARRYPLREAVGHEHVAPGRKHDPGEGFDWAALRRALRCRSPWLVGDPDGRGNAGPRRRGRPVAVRPRHR